jgi:hypothetical protein
LESKVQKVQRAQQPRTLDSPECSTLAVELIKGNELIESVTQHNTLQTTEQLAICLARIVY